MPDLFRGSAFAELFRGFSRSARRLETRDRYAGDQALFDRWRQGELDEPALTDKVAAWLEQVRETTAAGGRYERVRVVREPPTDYQRFALATCRASVEAGEDIRYLPRREAVELALPDHDFWLFDDERLALLYFTADDGLLGAQALRDVALLDQHRRWFELAFEAAQPYREYLAADPTREQRPS